MRRLVLQLKYVNIILIIFETLHCLFYVNIFFILTFCEEIITKSFSWLLIFIEKKFNGFIFLQKK